MSRLIVQGQVEPRRLVTRGHARTDSHVEVPENHIARDSSPYDPADSRHPLDTKLARHAEIALAAAKFPRSQPGRRGRPNEEADPAIPSERKTRNRHEKHECIQAASPESIALLLPAQLAEGTRQPIGSHSPMPATRGSGYWLTSGNPASGRSMFGYSRGGAWMRARHGPTHTLSIGQYYEKNAREKPRSGAAREGSSSLERERVTIRSTRAPSALPPATRADRLVQLPCPMIADTEKQQASPRPAQRGSA